MTQTYYYQDAMIKSFTASIIHTGTEEDGRHYVVLSNTAFYPTGGGQPHDTGVINGVTVNDVEKINGEIRHYVADLTSFEGVTGTVAAEIDWTRRFDHMQQHTGQHILTAAFVEQFDFATVSFHLGTGYVAIDLNTTSVSEAQLALAEKRANDIILENRPIETKWVTAEEVAGYPLRKELKVDGPIRLVIIPDFDYNGCGGTHPTSTGQVQAIKIMGTEKMKQNIRVHFVCGGRVLQELHKKNNVLTDVAKQLSMPSEAAGDALRKVLTDAKATEKALNEATDRLLEYEAKEIVQAAQSASLTAIVKHFEARNVQQLQKLARFITQQDATLNVGLIGEFDDKFQFVAARGSQSAQSMKAVAQSVLPLLEGKGGGSDQLAQGGGAKLISAEALIEALTTALLSN